MKLLRTESSCLLGAHIESNMYGSVLPRYKQFENLILLLDTATWSKIIGDFGDAAITKIVSMLRNNCQLENILPEWTVLKSYMMPIIKNNLKAKYLDIWKIIFNDDNIIKECRNAHVGGHLLQPS